MSGIARSQSAERGAPEPGEAWYAMPAAEVAERLQADPNTGLIPDEVRQRLERYGPNRLEEQKRESFWEEFFEELREPLILLLFVTGIIYIVLGELGDGITIFVVILLLNTVEVVNEQRARQAIGALQKLAEPTALVLRSSVPQETAVDEIVPGDVLLLQAGRRVPADARLLESFGLAADESALTGESLPVEKSARRVEVESTPLAERADMVYSGTLITRGRGKAVVVATGMQTELGRVAGLARGVRARRTPLQEAMAEVSKSLVWVALGFSILIPLLGVVIAHQPFQKMILTGLSLAFATIPEEMPIIITMVLALGAYRLSRQNAIVKHLQAVETLGAVTVIATDKTGTLTQNLMTVSEIVPEINRQAILVTGYLCNDSIIEGEEITGDPLEAALIRAAREAGIDGPGQEAEYPRQTEFSFDNERKRMSVVTENRGLNAHSQYGEQGTIENTENGELVLGEARQHPYRVWVKGAPESVLAVSVQARTEAGMVPLDEDARQNVLEQAAEMAGRGLRVIAFAEKRTTEVPADAAEAESGLIFLGLAGLFDPPREEVWEAIRVMDRAGIRSLMITGDHPLTAQAIAAEVGLDGQGETPPRVVTGTELDRMDPAELEETVQATSVFARTTPENKLRIVQALEARGERVAVTGDGINDAPALAAADIGVAMGETGSDVAREAGDIVLADDNYTTIANAVREGRHLFANLKKGVRYYLAIKVALVAVVLLPVLLQIPVPFEPIQIILMELFMDLAASAGFVSEPPEADLMRRPPRNPDARFLDREMVTSIFVGAIGLFGAVSAAYLLTWYSGAGLVYSQTVAFAAWMVGHVLLALNMRSEREPVFKLGLFSNRVMDGWALATAAFIILVTMVPLLERFIKTTSLDLRTWGLIVGLDLVGTFWLEAWKWVRYGRRG